MSRKNREYLSSVSETPQQVTTIINPQVARLQPIIFGFKRIDLNRRPFDCSPGQGERLLVVINTLKIHSGVERYNLELTYHNSHAVPPEQIREHNLYHLVALSPSGKLHQLGKKRTPVRVIGFFDNPFVNLFQVCLLDLDHELSGD